MPEKRIVVHSFMVYGYSLNERYKIFSAIFYNKRAAQIFEPLFKIYED